VNLATKSKIGTVGPALPGVAVRIADDGEIEVKGVNVFKEYWKNPAATAETFDGDWLKTGDIGSFDSEGFLTITGRKKEIIVTAGGKNVAPAVLEERLKAHRLISQVMVVGDQRPFIGALITLDADELRNFATERGLQGGPDELARSNAVREEVDQAVAAANEAVSRAESIRRSTILERDFTIEHGELTPTLKVRRMVVVEHFGEAIDGLYAQ
jgi:long-chain acyl-CoA synthetase